MRLKDRYPDKMKPKKRNDFCGYIYYRCFYCYFSWREASKNCYSDKQINCRECGYFVRPTRYERHPEWRLDKNGNIAIKFSDYTPIYD